MASKNTRWYVEATPNTGFCSSMRFTRLILDNWRNFRRVDLQLERRVFIVGPNASGKSNVLDAFRFLRDLAKPEGGFQGAVRERGGVSQIRCLHARRQPNVSVEVEAEIRGVSWGYRLDLTQDNQRRPVVALERVTRDGATLLDRPDSEDRQDRSRLSQTHLEQVTANKAFRELVDFLAEVRYLHVVPQLIRDPRRVIPVAGDPFGGDFLQQLARTPKKTLEARLRKINRALQSAVPQLRELRLERDSQGVPHLLGLYEHWRPKAGWQSEEHLSDGTIRLIGLLWAFLDGDHPLLLEEPELSLHAGVVRHIPTMMARAGRKTGRQVILSTHSRDLMLDEGIGPEEVVLLIPSQEATQAQLAAGDSEIYALLEGGVPIADAVFPRTAPAGAAQLALFGT